MLRRRPFAEEDLTGLMDWVRKPPHHAHRCARRGDLDCHAESVAGPAEQHALAESRAHEATTLVGYSGLAGFDQPVEASVSDPALGVRGVQLLDQPVAGSQDSQRGRAVSHHRRTRSGCFWTRNPRFKPWIGPCQ
jgi:hypothetical protein